MLSAPLAATLATAADAAVGDKGAGRPPSSDSRGSTAVRLLLESGEAINLDLDDNPTAHDFLTLLPLRVTLDDYAETEKISDLPRRLSTAGAPDGFEPSVGDVAYYAPWGNLAIFHKRFRFSPKLIRIGVITDAGAARLASTGPLAVTIETSR